MATVQEARTTDPRLADHAATAALYVTHPERIASIRGHRPSDVETLGAIDPSISPPGGVTLAEASAAASLAHTTRRPLEIWRPGKLPEAEIAAYHARDYRIETPEPQPRVDILSVEGLKTAAVLAARDSRALTTSSPPPPNPKYQYLAEEHVIMSGGRVREDKVIPSQEQGALLAATGAVRNTRKRAESVPAQPAVHPEAGYALSAATISHRARPTSDVYLEDLEEPFQPSLIHNIAKANAQLYTSNPPVDVETEELNRRDTLRAAAISMAQGMYARSKKREDEGLTLEAVQGAQRGHSRLGKRTSLAGVDESAATRVANLQLAAQRLAAEKLARMQGENEYQAYYGTAPPPRTRRSVTGRLRRRTSSETDASRIDMERSIRIRNQMSTLQTQLNEVDEKRRRDREDLMNIARRNVHAAIQDIDDKLYAETGKPSPAMQREWEEKAQERARRSLETESHLDLRGKVDIGDRHYVDAVDVEAVARSRIQPTLNDIDERAEERKARDIERRLDEEEKKRLRRIEREREADLKAAKKKQKAANKREMKERKAAAAEQELLDKDDEWKIFRRKSKRVKGKEPTTNGGPTSQAQEATSEAQEPTPEAQEPAPETREPAPEAQEPAPQQDALEDESGGTTSATEQVSPISKSPKGESRLKTWFRESFVTRMAKPPAEPQETTKLEEEQSSSFVGGAALTGATRDDPRGTALSSHPVKEDELSQPTTNGHAGHDEASETSSAVRQWSTSTGASEKDVRLSNNHSMSNGRSRLRMNFKNIMRRSEDRSESALSPRSPTAAQAESIAADTSRRESVQSDTAERNELQDSFQEETLAVPPPLRTVVERTSSSPNRDSRFLEDL